MAVDVMTEVKIDRPAATVAAYVADPTNAPGWYVNIKSVAWISPPVVQIGGKVAFVAKFLGRRLEYTYEIVEFEPGRLMTMRTDSGPFAMETSYRWEDAGDGQTRMTLRNRGNPRGFSRLVSPRQPEGPGQAQEGSRSETVASDRSPLDRLRDRKLALSPWHVARELTLMVQRS